MNRDQMKFFEKIDHATKIAAEIFGYPLDGSMVDADATAEMALIFADLFDDLKEQGIPPDDVIADIIICRDQARRTFGSNVSYEVALDLFDRLYDLGEDEAPPLQPAKQGKRSKA